MEETAKQNTVQLTNNDIKMATLRWWLSSQLTYNYQRMQAGGFATMMGPILKKLYPDNPGEVQAGLKRHMMFFNTEPRWGAVIHGITVALEEQRAKNPQAISETMIIDLKSSLMGPMAGLGDTITQALFRPILRSLCIAWAAAGNALGPIVFGVVGILFDYFVTFFSLKTGYKLGTEALTKLLDGGLFKKMTTFFSILGLFVLGVMVCKFVTIDLSYEAIIEGKKVGLKTLVDQVLPKALPLLLVVGSWRAMLKGWSVIKMLMALFIVALIGGALGIIK